MRNHFLPQMKRRICILVIIAASPALARTNAPPAGWSPFLKGGSVYHSDAGLEGGGDFSLHRFYAEGGMAYMFRKDRMVSFSGGYGQDDYNFGSLGVEPWNNIENVRVGLFSRWTHADTWSTFIALSARAYGETDADFSKAITGAAFGGASCRFSDRFSLGPGLGVVGQLEDHPRYFPIVVVDWDVTDKLNLSNGGGLAATGGPGLVLTYRASRHWRFGFGGRYERKRFRLADRGLAPEGVGEDRGIPLYGSVGYILYPGTQISALLGATLNGRIQAEDGNGTIVYEAEYDDSMFAGISWGVRF